MGPQGLATPLASLFHRGLRWPRSLDSTFCHCGLFTLQAASWDLA